MGAEPWTDVEHSLAYLAGRRPSRTGARVAARLVAHLPERSTGSSTSAPVTVASSTWCSRPDLVSTGVGLDLTPRCWPGPASASPATTGSRSSSTTSTTRCRGDGAVRPGRLELRHPPPGRRAQAGALRGGLRPARARAASSSTSSTWPPRPPGLHDAFLRHPRHRPRRRRPVQPARPGRGPARSGCARSASPTSTASGSGASWRCSPAPSRSRFRPCSSEAMSDPTTRWAPRWRRAPTASRSSSVTRRAGRSRPPREDAEALKASGHRPSTCTRRTS